MCVVCVRERERVCVCRICEGVCICVYDVYVCVCVCEREREREREERRICMLQYCEGVFIFVYEYVCVVCVFVCVWCACVSLCVPVPLGVSFVFRFSGAKHRWGFLLRIHEQRVDMFWSLPASSQRVTITV